MMNFTIDRFTDVLVRSVNIRAEMHGEEPVPALDIGLRLVGSNSLLGRLDPSLKRMLYKAADDTDVDDPELDGIEPATDLPTLRTGVLGMPLALTREYSGMALEIDYGLGGARNIVVSDCDINNFKVDAKEGGTVELDFRVQASGVDGKVLGQIGTLVRHSVQVTLTGPSIAQGEVAAATATTVNPFKHSVGKNGGLVDNNPMPDAGDIFAASVTASGASAGAADLDKTELPRASAKKTAAFTARAKVALKAAAAKKKLAAKAGTGHVARS